MLKPVTGYFWRRMIRHMYAATDKRVLDWFNGLFRPDDHLCPNEACEWPIVHCHYSQDMHINGLEKEDEKIEFQKRTTGLSEENAAGGQSESPTGVVDAFSASPL